MVYVYIKNQNHDVKNVVVQQYVNIINVNLLVNNAELDIVNMVEKKDIVEIVVDQNLNQIKRYVTIVKRNFIILEMHHHNDIVKVVE